MNKEVTIVQTTGETTGRLTHFLIEPFVPHEEEYYLAFTSKADADIIHFSTKGGVDIEAVWDSVVTIEVPVAADAAVPDVSEADIISHLPDIAKKETVAEFIKALFSIYRDYYFAYLEFNPIAFSATPSSPWTRWRSSTTPLRSSAPRSGGRSSFPRRLGALPPRKRRTSLPLMKRQGHRSS